MYARLNLNGDGVVDSRCKPLSEVPVPTPIVAGNLGVYSGCAALPEVNGNLYNISSNYVPMMKQLSSTNYLNSLGLTEMPDYRHVANEMGGTGIFYPMDGRIVSNTRNIPLILDKPAAVGNVDMDLVSTFDNSNYGAHYRTYSDIQNGQIGYYVDPALSQPFEYPVYTLSSHVDKLIRKDPMDSVKPEYILRPIVSTLYNVSNDQQTRDTLLFREELMSRQQNKNNRTRWTNRWVVPPSTFSYLAPQK
jgi:hypothetical protein